MQNQSENNNARKLRNLLASTCLATGLVAMPAVAQDVTVIGLDLGNGKDKGQVAGGTAIATGGSDVLGIGVSAGNGADDIENIGLIFVDVDASDIDIFQLFPVGATGLFSNAVGYGLFGGNGPDDLINSGQITVDVLSSGFITNPGLTIFGAPNYVAPSLVSAHGVGIEGGNRYDTILNYGAIDVLSTADIVMIGETPSLFAGDVGIDISAIATTIGLNGTTEFLTTANYGVMNLDAAASASLVTLDISVLNGFLSNTVMSADADVVGIMGDEIIEVLINDGEINGASTASAVRGSGIVSMADGGVSDAGVNATATYTGIRAEGEADTVENNGVMNIAAHAEIDSVDVEINVADVAGGTFTLTPYAEVNGIDGGWGDDSLLNTGSINAEATSDVVSVGVNLSLIDATSIFGRISGLIDTGEPEGPAVQAFARGIYGGDGFDTLTNDFGALINVDATADAHSTEISVAAVGVPDAIFSVTIDGDRLASLDTAAISEITGMDGGGMNDVLSNGGFILGNTSSSAEQIGVAVSVPAGFLPDETDFIPGFTMGGAGALAISSGAGMAGRDGDDALSNTGVILLGSSSDASAIGVSVELPDVQTQNNSDDGLPLDISFTMADIATEAMAGIIGMAGGGGNDTVENLLGVVNVSSTAEASSLGIGVTAAFEKEGAIIEGVLVRGTALGEAKATALSGGDGDDVITNTGIATAAASGEAQTDSVSVGLQAVQNSGLAVGVAAVDGSANAKGDATGLSGDAGNDLITNSGVVLADATADAGAVGVSVEITGVASSGAAGAGALAKTGATSAANAKAIDGGEGDDDILTSGAVSAIADASAATDSIGVSFAGASNGGAIGISAVDAAADATANALAVSGGDGADLFVNEGALFADANSDASAVGVSVGIAGIANTGLAGAGALSRTGATATSTATGVDWTSDDRGAVNTGSITTVATSSANSTSVGVSLAGATTGLVLSATLLEAGTEATSTSSAFAAPDGDNSITNYSTLSSTAQADASSTGVGVTVGLALNAGATGGFSLANAVTDATANSIALNTDIGADTIVNFGTVESVATANSTPTSVSIALNGAMTGVAINAALADASSEASGTASAISTGALDDVIFSSGNLTATANGLASSGSVAVEIAGTNTGLSGGAAWARGGVDGSADATAISAGSGADSVVLSGVIDALATAQADATSVSVALQGAVTGVAVGASLVEASSDANAHAAAVNLGADDDYLSNEAAITANSMADASAAGVSVEVAATGTGLSVGGSLSETTTTAKATTGAIEGGLGADEIVNSGAIDADAVADASSTSVSVALVGSVTGVAVSGALSDATVTAKATTTGIAGDEADDQDEDAAADAAGEHGDIILSTAVIDAYAEATSTGAAVSVNVPVAFVPIGASLATASTDASALSYGIDGGLGGDVIMVSDDIFSTSLADAGGASVSASLAGFVLGDFDAGATSTAIGIEGGAGDDSIASSGLTVVQADAEATGTTVNVTLAGGAVGALSTAATANSFGLSGGAGNDGVAAEGAVASTANAVVGGTDVTVEIVGFTLDDASAAATATATGVDGGDGHDALVNTASVTSNANATANATSVGVILAGAIIDDATTSAMSTAYGVNGAAGDDVISVLDTVSSTSFSTASNVGVDVSAVGATVSDTSVLADALAVGVGGGDGFDQISSTAGINAAATSDVSLTSVDVVLGGASVTQSTITGLATAMGIDGGDGGGVIISSAAINADAMATGGGVDVGVSALGFDGTDVTTTVEAHTAGIASGDGADGIMGGGAITSSALADVTSTAVSVNLVGASITDAGVFATSSAKGIDSGAGGDVILANGVIDVDAMAFGNGVNVGVTGVGFGSAETSTTVTALSAGIDGGSGGDTIETNAAVDAKSKAGIDTTSVLVNLAGGANNDSTSTAEAIADGVAGGAGADDITINSAVNATADAFVDGLGVSVQIAGGTDADLSGEAIATASGVNGGDDDDVIVNNDIITVIADAEADANNVNVQFVGASFADANVTATARATGIAGGEGGDTIINDGAIFATSTSTTDADNVNVALVSGAFSDANTTANAFSAGIDAGNGDNFIVHSGSLSSSSSTSLEAGNVNVGLAGGSFVDIRMTANADASGIISGAGADQLVTETGSTINVLSSITGNANNTNIELIGAAFDNNVFGYDVSASGIDTGGGNDGVFLSGVTDVDAKTSFTLTSTQVTLLGAGFEKSRIASDATAYGLKTGAGDDSVSVDGRIDVFADTSISSGGTTQFGLIGFVSSKPRFGGVATAIGIDLGADNDMLVTSDTVKSFARSKGAIGGNQISIIGASSADGSIGARSSALGVGGGSGNDMMLTTAVTDVDAQSSSTLTSLGFTWIGATSANGAISVGSTATGQDGGAGDDTAGNSGAMYVDAKSTLTTSGSVAVSLGSASSGASTKAVSSANGMLGGDGNDFLFNTGTVRARATSSGTVNRTSYAFIGGSSASATATTDAKALGMGGGSGNDVIENSGSVEARATATTDAGGNTTSTVGSAKSSSSVSAVARAVGLAGDSGDDYIKNFGALTVVASASPDSTNGANTGGFFTNGVTNSRTSTSTRVIGIDAGSGINQVWNTGTIFIDTIGHARTESRSDGDLLDNIFGLDLNAIATATTSNNGQDARGVSAGNEATSLVNDGVIDVGISGSGYAYANADGDAFASGDGTASATVGVSSARAYGFVAGSGGNYVQNNGTITILSRPTANADSISDADGIDLFRDPDSRATTNVAVGSARAAGIWFNDGNDIIENHGSITATASPQANQAEADAGHGADIASIDTFATATASANGAQAYGIRAGNGDNFVLNTGTIIATASPRAVANASAIAIGLDGDAEARATANAKNAVARGVQTGSGDDFIWNDGSITAISKPSVSASAHARETINGSEVETAKTSISGRSALAVETGSGDDTLVNTGTITGSLGGGVGNGAAINMGAGDDTLALFDGSLVRGSINLSTGNDTLVLSGNTAATSAPSGSSGTDTLVFEGAGAFILPLSSFEKAQKTGGGLFNVSFLSSMQEIDVRSGTLRVAAHPYALSGSGAFKAFVDGDGTFGQFSALGFVTLGGSATVSKGASLFSDGQTFDIVSAPVVNGSFASVALPDATPLLSFSSTQTSSAFQVIASVVSMTTVASSSETDLLFAAQLDEAAAVSSGGLQARLAELQHAPSGYDFEGAIADLNPASVDAFTQETASSLDELQSGVRQRLAALRASRNSESDEGADFLNGAETLRFTQSDQLALGQNVTTGAWRAEFGAPLMSSGESSGVVSGIDYLFGGDALLGASFGAIRSVSPLSFASDAKAEVDNFVFSLYGSKLVGDNGYIDGFVSYGDQESRSAATSLLNVAQDAAIYDHSGRNLTFSFEGGRSMKAAGGVAELFGGLSYRGISDRELDHSIDGVNYTVESRFSQTMRSDLGARIGWAANTQLGHVEPRVSLTWRHDLDLADNGVVARFDDAPTYEFRLPGLADKSDRLMVGGAIDLYGASDWSLSARFEADALDGFKSGAGVLEVMLPF